MNPDRYAIIFFAGTFLLILFAIVFVVAIVVHKRKQYHLFAEKLKLQHRFDTQLLETKLEVQEQSFRYFSEEIHDNVGQILTLCNLNLHELLEENSDLRSKSVFEQTAELINKALNDLRNISHTLNGDHVTRVGLKGALEKELSYINSSRKTGTALIVTGDNHPLNPEQELLVFRIVQEGITNALKHGRARKIDIRLLYASDSLTVEIADDGQGFDTNNYSSKGLGLSNMNLRARLLGGHIAFNSIAEKGTIATLIIPVKP
ncbi:MAG: hypothetical protein EOP56_00955 [Sphingobacteriales bacterium]|nr:MAG: hypothetical protein EOP56_00955 [Sphingobacteriales bacterium]